MRKTFLISVLWALLVSFACGAQDTLFRIISAKGLVTLDNDTLKNGVIVTNINRSLEIKGKLAYATILTEKGFAFQLGRGKYTVKEISKAEYSNLQSNLNSNKFFGPAIQDDFFAIRLIKIPKEKIFLFGDSLTVLARPYKEQVDQYRLVITNLLGEELYDSTSTSHIQTVKIAKLPGKNSAFILNWNPESKLSSKSYYIKTIASKDSSEFSYDLDYVKSPDFINRQLSILALYEIHELYFDQLHQLYKLWRYSQNTGTKIENAYYQRLFKEYELEKFLPVPLTGY